MSFSLSAMIVAFVLPVTPDILWRGSWTEIFASWFRSCGIGWFRDKVFSLAATQLLNTAEKEISIYFEWFVNMVTVLGIFLVILVGCMLLEKIHRWIKWLGPPRERMVHSGDQDALSPLLKETGILQAKVAALESQSSQNTSPMTFTPPSPRVPRKNTTASCPIWEIRVLGRILYIISYILYYI